MLIQKAAVDLDLGRAVTTSVFCLGPPCKSKRRFLSDSITAAVAKSTQQETHALMGTRPVSHVHAWTDCMRCSVPGGGLEASLLAALSDVVCM